MSRAPLYYGLLLCCVTVSRQISITEFEVPIAAKVGDAVELRCRFELAPGESQPIVKWWATTHGDEPRQLYQRMDKNLPSKLPDVDLKLPELDTIILRNRTPADSGVYACEVSVATMEEARKQQSLTIYSPGSGVNLNHSLVADGPDEDELEDVRVDCWASGVAPAPDLIITVGSKELLITKQVSGPDKSGLYDVSANASVSAAEAAGAELSCDLVYLDPNIAHPRFTASDTYSGAASTTELPAESVVLVATTEAPSINQTTGGCSQSRVSWALLVATLAHFARL